MKAEKYGQLSEVHVMQRIWRNELTYQVEGKSAGLIEISSATQ